MINKAYKVKLYPNKTQTNMINQTIGNCRFIYNQMLAERISVFEKLKNNKEKLYSYKYKTEKEYKQEFNFLSNGSSRALQQSRINLQTAFKNFFMGLKTNKTVGFPKFKAKHKSKLSYRESNISDFIKIKSNKVRLLKLGFIKFRGLSKDFTGIIKSVTVLMDRDGKYYASILTEQEQVVRERKSDNVIGVDLGIKEFVVLSTGECISGIKEVFNILTKKIDQANKYLSRKTRESNRYERQRKKLNRLYKKRTNTTNHFFWHLANKICSENQAVSIEHLQVSGMIRNRKLSKAIARVSWSSFIEKLNQKASEYETQIYQVDRFFPSSKLCSGCGLLKSNLTLSDRIYKCDCGLEIDRDLNASINLRNAFLKEYPKSNQDYRRGEILNLKRINFDLKSSFDETSLKKVA